MPGAAWLVVLAALGPLLLLKWRLLRLLLTRRVLPGALLVLQSTLLSLVRLQRLLFLGLPLRLFVHGALPQRGFVLPALLLLRADGFKLLALLVAQQALLLAPGLFLRVASTVGPGWLARRHAPVWVAAVLRLLAQRALTERFFVRRALQADARLLLLLEGQFPLPALLVEGCALLGVPRIAFLLRRRRG